MRLKKLQDTTFGQILSAHAQGMAEATTAVSKFCFRIRPSLLQMRLKKLQDTTFGQILSAHAQGMANHTLFQSLSMKRAG
jgi:hypothetical protein